MTEEERKETQQRIVPTTTLKDLSAVDFVIEVSFSQLTSVLELSFSFFSYTQSNELRFFRQSRKT
jgi:hypothetical protein